MSLTFSQNEMDMPKDAYSVGLRTRITRIVLRFMIRLIFRTLYRVSIAGLENVPREGAYLVAHNHISIVEPPFIISFWPRVLEAIGAAEVFSRRGQAVIVRLYRGIPVHRGQFDRTLIETVVRVLESERPLIIAPEGSRSHEPGLKQAWPGIGYLVEKCRVPVIPVGVVGSTPEMFQQALRLKRPRLSMRIGPPVLLPATPKEPQAIRAARQSNTDIIMRHIAAQLPGPYQGIYAVGHRDSP
jgi:1-acyl-sn-glycerol-3-phosphate acyltransferase